MYKRFQNAKRTQPFHNFTYHRLNIKQIELQRFCKHQTQKQYYAFQAFYAILVTKAEGRVLNMRLDVDTKSHGRY